VTNLPKFWNKKMPTQVRWQFFYLRTSFPKPEYCLYRLGLMPLHKYLSGHAQPLFLPNEVMKVPG